MGCLDSDHANTQGMVNGTPFGPFCALWLAACYLILGSPAGLYCRSWPPYMVARWVIYIPLGKCSSGLSPVDALCSLWTYCLSGHIVDGLVGCLETAGTAGRKNQGWVHVHWGPCCVHCEGIYIAAGLLVTLPEPWISQHTSLHVKFW